MKMTDDLTPSASLPLPPTNKPVPRAIISQGLLVTKSPGSVTKGVNKIRRSLLPVSRDTKDLRISTRGE